MKKVLLSTVGAYFMCLHLLWAQSFQEVGQLLPTPDLSSKGHQYGESVAIEGNFAVIGAPGENAAYVLFYNGNEWVQQSKLTASDGGDTDQFGKSVDIKDDVVIVGAPYHTGDGMVYVFKNQQGDWSAPEQTAKLAYDYKRKSFQGINFGYSVDITTDLIVVGSYREAIFVFEKPEGGWKNATQTAVLTQTSPDFLTSFGRKISVSGNTIVSSDERINNNTGLAYIYEKPSTGWQDATETTTLKASGQQGDYYFGSSIDLQGNVLAVGATGYDAYGAVYLFEKSATGWQNITYTAKLTAADENFERLGRSVQLFNNTIVVGSENGGAVFLYERPASGWVSASQPTAKLEATDGDRYSTFGHAVSTNGDGVIAGAPTLGEGGTVYFYRRPNTGWSSTAEDQRMTAPLMLLATEDRFGSSVDIDGDYAVVSSPNDNQNGRGAAYVFHYYDRQWNKVAKLTPATAESNVIFSETVSISDNTIVISTSGYDEKVTAYVYEQPTSGWQDMTESAKLNIGMGKLDKFVSRASVDDGTVVVSIADYQEEAAYVFERPTGGWTDMTSKAVLTASGNEIIGFGSAIAVSGSTIVVGAPYHGDRRPGALYVFEKPTTGWVDMNETAQLTASNSVGYDQLGASVSMTNGIIVAGASNRSFSDKAAYVFEKPVDGWVDMRETAQLTGYQVGGTYMGGSVSVSENAIALNASGAVLIYERPTGGWANMQQTLKIDVGSSVRSVALSSNKVMAGAPYENFQGKNSGAAYVYVLVPNNPPALATPIKNVTINVHETLTLVLDPATFTDADEDALSYAATLSDGSSLPDWLSFDADRLTFSGTPQEGDVNTINIEVVAQDNSSEVTATFVLTVQAPKDTTEPTEETEKEEESATETAPGDKEEPVLVVDEEETVTGVDDEVTRNTRVYPNPSVGELTITSADAIEQLRLSNAQGQEVLRQEFAPGPTEVKLSDLAPGLYWVSIRTGQSTQTQRIIVR